MFAPSRIIPLDCLKSRAALSWKPLLAWVLHVLLLSSPSELDNAFLIYAQEEKKKEKILRYKRKNKNNQEKGKKKKKSTTFPARAIHAVIFHLLQLTTLDDVYAYDHIGVICASRS